jgi:hypothetical protein
VRNSLILNCSCLSGKASGKAPRECESLSLPLLGCVSTYYMTVRRGHVIAPRRGRPTDLPPPQWTWLVCNIHFQTERDAGGVDSTRLDSVRSPR